MSSQWGEGRGSAQKMILDDRGGGGPKAKTTSSFCLSNLAFFEFCHHLKKKNSGTFLPIFWLSLELVSKEFNHFGVIAGLFRRGS